MQDQLTTRRTARHDRPDRPRKTRLLVLLLAFLVLLGGVYVGAHYYENCSSPGPATTGPVRFTVAQGASASDVVGHLADAKLINCGGFVGNLLMRGTGKAAALRAGTYTLRGGMSLEEIVGLLSTPPKQVATADVLIPPGYRVDPQIADRLQETLGIPATPVRRGRPERPVLTRSRICRRVRRRSRGSSTPTRTVSPTHGETPSAVITTLLDEFRLRTKGLPWKDARHLGVTPYQIVVIASMIEKEAGIDADRPKIAAVIYNRLRRGMPLGIDATVAYIDPNPSDGLTDADLAIDSPYNTRLQPGLPPTPIASPGLSLVEAALAPAHVAVPLLRGLWLEGRQQVQLHLSPVPRRQGALPWLSRPGRRSAGRAAPWASSAGPSTHSLSPAIHNAAFAAMDMDVGVRAVAGARRATFPTPSTGWSPSASPARTSRCPTRPTTAGACRLAVRGRPPPAGREHARDRGRGAPRSQHGRARLRPIPAPRRGVRAVWTLGPGVRRRGSGARRCARTRACWPARTHASPCAIQPVRRVS